MVMCSRIGDREADRDEVEERRVGHFYSVTPEIVPGMEDKLEPADAGVFGADQRPIGSSVRIGRDVGDEHALASGRELVELHPDAFRWPSAGDIEHVGGEAGQAILRRGRQMSDVPLYRDDAVAATAPAHARLT
jgi:hypothetical protein